MVRVAVVSLTFIYCLHLLKRLLPLFPRCRDYMRFCLLLNTRIIATWSSWQLQPVGAVSAGASSWERHVLI